MEVVRNIIIFVSDGMSGLIIQIAVILFCAAALLFILPAVSRHAQKPKKQKHIARKTECFIEFDEKQMSIHKSKLKLKNSAVLVPSEQCIITYDEICVSNLMDEDEPMDSFDLNTCEEVSYI